MTQLVRQGTKLLTVKNLLERAKPAMTGVLPKHITADKMVRVALGAVRTTPQLLKCDQMSLLGAIMESATLGLEPNGVLGDAYLVPYKKVCQFIPGYKGLVKLAIQSHRTA